MRAMTRQARLADSLFRTASRRVANSLPLLRSCLSRDLDLPGMRSHCTHLCLLSPLTAALSPLFPLQPSTTHLYSILTQQAQAQAAPPQYIHTSTHARAHTHTYTFFLSPPLPSPFLSLSRLLTLSPNTHTNTGAAKAEPSGHCAKMGRVRDGG